MFSWSNFFPVHFSEMLLQVNDQHKIQDFRIYRYRIDLFWGKTFFTPSFFYTKIRNPQYKCWIYDKTYPIKYIGLKIPNPCPTVHEYAGVQKCAGGPPQVFWRQQSHGGHGPWGPCVRHLRLWVQLGQVSGTVSTRLLKSVRYYLKWISACFRHRHVWKDGRPKLSVLQKKKKPRNSSEMRDRLLIASPPNLLLRLAFYRIRKHVFNPCTYIFLFI